MDGLDATLTNRAGDGTVVGGQAFGWTGSTQGSAGTTGAWRAGGDGGSGGDGGDGFGLWNPGRAVEAVPAETGHRWGRW
ncbi:hypothetical protein MMRN_27400 [Mycobacterium marinum]|nr:hypothetical protein MMRN_27400 [Mycobacterium marinum]